jgi:hypothetical protein
MCSFARTAGTAPDINADSPKERAKTLTREGARSTEQVWLPQLCDNSVVASRHKEDSTYTGSVLNISYNDVSTAARGTHF